MSRIRETKILLLITSGWAVTKSLPICDLIGLFFLYGQNISAEHVAIAKYYISIKPVKK